MRTWNELIERERVKVLKKYNAMPSTEQAMRDLFSKDHWYFDVRTYEAFPYYGEVKVIGKGTAIATLYVPTILPKSHPIANWDTGSRAINHHYGASF